MEEEQKIHSMERELNPQIRSILRHGEFVFQVLVFSCAAMVLLIWFRLVSLWVS